MLNGEWAHGLNIFAVTGSLLIICVASVVTMIVQRLLTIMARTFGAKGETVCRLLKSLVKYISVIAMLYFCLALLGIDTATLLASAGILTLIVGLARRRWFPTSSPASSSSSRASSRSATSSPSATGPAPW